MVEGLLMHIGSVSGVAIRIGWVWNRLGLSFSHSLAINTQISWVAGGLPDGFSMWQVGKAFYHIQ